MATYYVDATGGADGNNGLSTGAAWQTLTNVNGTTFSPGDQILFKRGETWTGTVVATASGTISNPITYGAYGTGAKPIINGGVLLAGWSKTAGRTNVYEASVSGYNLDSVFSGSYATVWYGTDYRWMSKVADIATVDSTARSCFYDTAADKIYVRTAGSTNPGSDGVSYYISGYDIGVNLNGKSYVTVENIVFTRMCSHAVFPMVAGTPFLAGVGQTINDCEAYGVRHNGFSMAGSKMKANRCTVHYAGGEGGAFVVADLSDYPGIGQSIRTDDIEINECGTGSTSNVWAPGVYAPKAILMEFNPSNVKVRDFTMDGAQSYAFYDVDASYGATNVVIDGLYVKGKAIDSAIASYRTTNLITKRVKMTTPATNAVDIYNTTGFRITRSFLRGVNSNIRLDGTYSDVKIHNTIMVGGIYGVLASSGSGVSIYHNTVVGCSGFAFAPAAATPGVFDIKNNVAVNCGAVLYLAALGGITSDYNIGYNNTYWWLTYDLTNTQIIGIEAHSRVADPVLSVTPVFNYSIGSSSQCIGMGTNVNVTEDYFGNPRSSTPDVGAITYAKRYPPELNRSTVASRTAVSSRSNVTRTAV